MSILSCREVREMAPELALGLLDGPERAEAVMHIGECPGCQAYVLELMETADELPLLAPELEPPSGFEDRVLARIHTSRRRNRRVIPIIAAVVAAAAIFAFAAVRIADSNSSSGAVRTAAAAAPVAVEMRDPVAHVSAGWAYVTGGHSVAVAVDYGVSSGTYKVQLTPAHGRARSLGTMVVEGNRGSWTGRSDRAIRPGSTLALVDPTGRAVCHGEVGTRA